MLASLALVVLSPIIVALLYLFGDRPHGKRVKK